MSTSHASKWQNFDTLKVPKTSLKRYWNRGMWSLVILPLLNTPPTSPLDQDDVTRVIECLEVWLSESSQRKTLKSAVQKTFKSMQR